MQDNQDFRQDIQESHIPSKNSARIGKKMQDLRYWGKIEAGDKHVIILDTKTYKIMARFIKHMQYEKQESFSLHWKWCMIQESIPIPAFCFLSLAFT